MSPLRRVNQAVWLLCTGVWVWHGYQFKFRLTMCLHRVCVVVKYFELILDNYSVSLTLCCVCVSFSMTGAHA